MIILDILESSVYMLKIVVITYFLPAKWSVYKFIQKKILESCENVQTLYFEFDP